MPGKERTNWFHWYCDQLDKGVIKGAEPGVLYTCPCCGYPALDERGGYDICTLCFWEDDGQDEHNADLTLGGPNADYSLTEARANWESHLTYARPSDPQHFDADLMLLALKKELAALLSPWRWNGRVVLPPDADEKRREIEHKIDLIRGSPGR